MKYIMHKIKPDGTVVLREKMDNGNVHGSIIKPNKPIPEEYKSEIESDENFAKYRTKENATKYEEEQKKLEPTADELAEQEERRLLQEKRERVKAELRGSPAPQSNPELAKRVEKLEFVVGIRDEITE